MDGVRPVTPTEVEQMREEIFKDQESESILQDEDKTEEEDFPTYAQDSQEYMHWHYRLNHPTHTVMTKMAEQGMLPRGITKILTGGRNRRRRFSYICTRLSGIHALALQTESSNTHSHDKDGRTRNVTKRNHQNPNNHEQTTYQATNV
jgi:hypothetical protein